MKKEHWFLVALFAMLFAVLYGVPETVPPGQRKLASQRKLAEVPTDVGVLSAEARAALPADRASLVTALERSLSAAASDDEKRSLLEELSGVWYDFGYPSLSGHYAAQLAESVGGADAWGIAGTTFSICVQRADARKVREYCTLKAVECFEKAISIQPEEWRHRLNMALVHTENPPENEPMKGVLMLVELNREFPDQPAILTQLGRLALETGQLDKARERLEAVLRLSPDDRKAHCLLSTVYQRLQEDSRAAYFGERCNQLSEKAVE